MKGKARAIVLIGVLMAGIGGVKGEEIITDLPGSSEHSGAIYGSIYERKEEEPGGDIEIEVPPEGNGGGSTPDSNQGSQGGSKRPNTSTNSSPSRGNSTNSTASTKETGQEEYRWEKERGVLQIKKELMERAKEEKKGLVFRILNEEGKPEYRIRIEAKDIEEREAREIEVELGECPHREEIEGEIEKGEKAAGILLCQQKEIEIPMKIAVAVDRGWDREKGVEQYEYKEGKLRYEVSGVKIDEEGMVEIEMEEGKDRVFAKEEIETGGKTIQTFVEGITKGNEEVDRSKGTVAIVLGTVGIGLMATGVIKMMAVKGRIGKKI